MAKAAADVIRQAADEIRDDSTIATRNVRPFLIAVADFLTSCGNELADVAGRTDSCDEPGAVQAALAIARAYLGPG